MDAIDILGSILGKKSGGSSTGTKILRDILTGGSNRKSRPTRSSRGSSSRDRSDGREASSDYIAQEAERLEDMLNVANDRNAGRRRTTDPPSRTQRSPQPEPPRDSGFGRDAGDYGRQDQGRQDQGRQHDPAGELGYSRGELNDQAMILVRAMVNAAKSDGRISQDEQRGILKELESSSPDAIQFLRDEFSKPVDVKEFCWSVPLGMEQQVYTMSLIAIELDSNSEAKYLMDLAHGLRLSPHVCEQIHQRYNAPTIH